MKARKLISCALALIIIFGTLPVFTVSQAIDYEKHEIKAHSKRIGDWKVMPREKYDDDDIQYFSKEAYCIIGYYGYNTDIKIPSKLNGIPIFALYGNVFKGKKIKSVYIPESVYYLEGAVFKGNKTLKKVTFDSEAKVDYIESEAFKNCTALEEITLPKKVRNIGRSAFSGCTSLTTVKKTAKFYSVGSYAFAGCKKLKNIPLKKIEDFGYAAFKGCTRLTTANLAISEQLSGNVFENCTNLKSVHFSKKTRYVGRAIFKGCKSLEKISVDEQNNIYSIYDGALTRNNKAEIIAYPAARADNDFVIPSETKVVNKYAFYGAKKLKADLTFSNKIKQIGVGAFENCSLIEKISLPDTVKTISKHAFKNTAFMKAQKPNGAYYIDNILIRIDGTFDEYEIKEGTVFIAGTALDGCKVGTLTIPQSVTKFSNNALSGDCEIDTLVINSNITSLGGLGLKKVYQNHKLYNQKSLAKSTIKNVIVASPITQTETTFNYTTIQTISFTSDVRKINARAFFHCRNLNQVNFSNERETSINFSEKITSIGNYAFNGTNLSKVIIPDTVTKIGGCVFEDCVNLTYAKLPSTITKIPLDTFNNCKKLKSFEIEENITAIARRAFAFSGLKSIIIPDTVTEFSGGSIFKGCADLKSVRLPINDSIKAIPNSMFMKTSLTNIEIPNGYTTICGRAFCMSKLKNITLPNTIVEIKGAAFSKCKNLKSIKLPASLKQFSRSENTFDKGAFARSAIESISIPEGVKVIPKETFYECKSLKKVVLPSTTKQIYEKAFYNCTNLSKINLGKSLTHVYDKAFYNCKKLKSIKLPATIKKIGVYNAFSPDTAVFANSGLKSITIPKKVKTLGTGTFKGCKSLETVTIKGEVKTLHTNVFKNCTALKKIYIKKGTIDNINKTAFKGAKSGIKFYVNTKAQAKTLKGALEKTNIKSAKIYANNVLVYKNVG